MRFTVSLVPSVSILMCFLCWGTFIVDLFTMSRLMNFPLVPITGLTGTSTTRLRPSSVFFKNIPYPYVHDLTALVTHLMTNGGNVPDLGFWSFSLNVDDIKYTKIQPPISYVNCLIHRLMLPMRNTSNFHVFLVCTPSVYVRFYGK